MIPMDLSIVIVNWNTRKLLFDCLTSVYETVTNPTFEVIVVDNNSNDGSQVMIQQQFPHVHLIANQENVGFARANNQAIRKSQGRYILLLNSDTVVQPDALEAMVRFMDTHSQVGIVGSRLLNKDGTLQPSWARFPTVWSELMGKNFRTHRPYPTHDGSMVYEVDWVGGACLLIRRTVVEQVGLLDEGFFMYSEETDWCFRVKQQGWAVCYYPEAQVIHFGGQSSQKASARMKTQLYQSKLLFFHKHYGPRRARALYLSLRVLFTLKAILGKLICLLSLNRSHAGKSLYQDSMTLLQNVSIVEN